MLYFFDLFLKVNAQPDPPWPELGPVEDDGVDPDPNVQSKSSKEDWLHPEHKPSSKLHQTNAIGKNDDNC